MQRLDKILADAGLGTRSGLREMIRAGRVAVDGVCVTRPETKIDESAAAITADGKPVARAGSVTLLLYKPAGVVTSTSDPRDKTVMELLPEAYRRRGIAPVGRLDKETEGLLLLTDDGALAHHLISPRHLVDKRYYAEHEGCAGPDDVQAFADGLVLADGTVCLPAELEPLGPGKSLVTVREGKYHQVRRMLAARGMPVRYLRREEEAGLTLTGLVPGGFRELTAEELAALRR